MTSSVEIALQLPEILHAIARSIPLFEFSPQLGPSSRAHSDWLEAHFRPSNLLPCLLVSRLWNTCFTPCLYHFSVVGEAALPEVTNRTTFQQNSHCIRRLQYSQNLLITRIVNSRRFRLDTSALPRNLVGLFLYSFNDDAGQLLLLNQGPQLKQLTLRSKRVHRTIDKVYEDALMNLPCLEELDLRNWTIDCELMYRILDACSETLRVLRLGTIHGLDEELPSNIGNSESERRWILPHVKSLILEQDGSLSQAVVLLPRLCPALESFQIKVTGQGYSIPDLASSLRENCPKLHTIYHAERANGMVQYGLQHGDRASLILTTDCRSTPGLRSVTIAVHELLDAPLRDSLLVHSNTLVVVEIGSSISQCTGRPHPEIMESIGQLLCRCRHLKELRVWNAHAHISRMLELLKKTWKCRGLEALAISGYMPSYLECKSSRNSRHRRYSLSSSSHQDGHALEQNYQEARRRRLRQNARPRKFRHHEYRDNGQGWFLKAGLSKSLFREALADGDWKQRLFDHMYWTCGIRNAKYVRLNKTEFFSQEQPFDSLAAEQVEMMLEEDLVVDYRNMAIVGYRNMVSGSGASCGALVPQRYSLNVNRRTMV
ncbi:hypothetical protein B0O80DRAFT_445698 [Mortierella sp. GBAus27b]|nr:hypothetical protein B0O80DRAFT_445698 [Mortierella sp. GBAus27b]